MIQTIKPESSMTEVNILRKRVKDKINVYNTTKKSCAME